MPSALVPLVFALAASTGGEVAVVPAHPPAAPSSPLLTTRCAPLGKTTGEIECVVQQAARSSAAPAAIMRVRVMNATAPCPTFEAQAVAMPAAASTRAPPPGALPVVVQPGSSGDCSR